MMTLKGKKQYLPPMQPVLTWFLLAAVFMLTAAPVVSASLSQNRVGGYHTFFAGRTGVEPGLNAEPHQVYGLFNYDFAPGSPVASKNADIVLGRQQTLRSMSRNTGGKSYYAWQKEGLSSANPMSSKEFVNAFGEATSNAKNINFSLDGLNLRQAYTSGAKGPFEIPNNVTNWEFRQVLNNPKTVFYQNGKVVPYERVIERLGNLVQ